MVNTRHAVGSIGAGASTRQQKVFNRRKLDLLCYRLVVVMHVLLWSYIVWQPFKHQPHVSRCRRKAQPWMTIFKLHADQLGRKHPCLLSNQRYVSQIATHPRHQTALSSWHTLYCFVSNCGAYTQNLARLQLTQPHVPSLKQGDAGRGHQRSIKRAHGRGLLSPGRNAQKVTSCGMGVHAMVL